MYQSVVVSHVYVVNHNMYSLVVAEPEADCEGVWAIENGAFSCVSELSTLVIGTFTSNTSASGLAFEGEGGIGDFCAAVWDATPD